MLAVQDVPWRIQDLDLNSLGVIRATLRSGAIL